MPPILEPAITGAFSAVGVVAGVSLQELFVRLRDRRIAIQQKTMDLAIPMSRYANHNLAFSRSIAAASDDFWKIKVECKSNLTLICKLARRPLKNGSAIRQKAEECLYQAHLLEGFFNQSALPIAPQREALLESFNKLYQEVFPPSKTQLARIERNRRDLKNLQNKLSAE